ncbi:MAG: hypothetical protein GPJ50_03850 [Candidatus Heimdallarchaeota archaeon]|nr:hypothetical protein [Candidatus Heimdallarchaeota archaeon]
MKLRPKQDPNRARKRNFAKYRLAGMYSTLRSICEESNHYLASPLLKEERAALNSIFKDIKTVLKHWDKNYIKLKEREIKNERKT